MDRARPVSPAAGAAVVGVFDRDRLSGALVAVHRAGLGPQTRVFDGARGDLAGQLDRAGLSIPLDPAAEEAATALVVIAAPGRAAIAIATMTGAGANAVHTAERLSTRPAPSPVRPQPSPLLTADEKAPLSLPRERGVGG